MKSKNIKKDDFKKDINSKDGFLNPLKKVLKEKSKKKKS